MFKLQELGKLIETQLNFEGNNYTPAYSFIVHTEIGENTNNSYINCVLRVDKPKVSKVPGIKNNQYNFVLDLVIPANGANYDLASIETIIDNFVENYNGKEYSFKNGKAILSFSLTGTGNFKTEYGQGNIVPLSMNIFVNYSENVVLNKVYLLDDKILPYSFEELLLEKDGKTTPIYGEKYEQSFLTLQRKYYHFRLPNDDVVASDLLSDMLQGDMNKQYTLKFYDGNIFTEENPYETTVSIVRMGNAKHERPNTPELDITFADVDSGVGLTKYELALIDNPFDAQSENTRYFESQEVQQAYYENLIENGGANWDRIKAPNLNSIDLTNQIYKNTTGYDVFDLANKNYAIIKVTQYIEVVENDVATTQEKINYFYYFVQNSSIGLFNQVAYDLQLDSVQTYYFNPNIEFKGNFINKAHLDRWIDNGDGTISFNGTATSDLFEREEIKQVAKRLIYKERLILDTEDLVIPTDNHSDSIWDFYKTPVWVYIFLDGQFAFNGNEIKYSFSQIGQTEETLPQKTLDRAIIDTIISPTAILAFPLDSKYIGQVNRTVTSLTYQTDVSSDLGAFFEFCSNNSEIFSYIKSMKLSIKPPINFNELKYTGELTLDSDAITISFNNSGLQNGLTSYSGEVKFLITDSYNEISRNDNISQGIQRGLFYITYDNTTPFKLKLNNTSNLPKLSFNKNEIQTSLKNKKYNPKLNSVDYKELSIRIGGSNHIFDYQKINNSNPKFLYYEPLTCDTTKAIINYISESNNEIFSPYYSQSLNGLIYSNDMSLPIANSQFSQYLANNKNAYLSFQNQQNQAVINSLIGMTTSGIINTGNNINSINNSNAKTLNSSINSADLRMSDMGISMVGQALSIGLNQYYAQTQFDLSMDNMKNAPNIIANANGSALFINTFEKYGVYAEIYEGINIELEMANDIMYRDGFTYNRFGNIKDFDNIRKYFNYVKAVIGNIGGIAISNNARNNLRQRFLNGIRFWNSDNIDYSKENVEKSIEIEFDVDYDIRVVSIQELTNTPTSISYGDEFITQVVLKDGYNYTDIEVLISAEIDSIITPLYGSFFNTTTGIITLNTSDYPTILKNNGTIKISIVPSD